MKLRKLQPALFLLALLPMHAAFADGTVTISGIVRDSHGTPQMGAMVQAIGEDAAIAATAFTDIHGRYSLNSIDPGRYQIKATEALFLPSLRDNLTLHNGARAVVNLTLTTFFEAMQWLPAQHRRPGESEDDWKWTLRSAANRPILRMLEDGPLIMVSSSEDERVKPTLEARVAVTSGSSEFGYGGEHNVFTVDSVDEDGAGVILRADLAEPDPTVPSSPSAEIAAGYERRSSPLSTFRIAGDFTEHPEIVSSPGQFGMLSVGSQMAEEVNVAPRVVVDAGNEATVVHLGNQTGLEAQPFVSVNFHPSDAVLLQYRMATARDLQNFDDLDTVQPSLQVAVINAAGHIVLEHGLHQEFGVTTNTGRGRISAAFYHDDMTHPAINGSGRLDPADLFAGDVEADPSTATFRMLGNGYDATGVRIAAREPISDTTWVNVTYASGQSLSLPDGATANSLTSAMAETQVVRSNAFSLAVESRIAATGTHVSGSYRWQPASTITPVDAYGSYAESPYLSFCFRQPIHIRGISSHGIVAMVDVTNLLAQGYRPVISADGHTFYFTLSPRTVRGGLSFNF